MEGTQPAFEVPEWVVSFNEFHKRLFQAVVEPVIVLLLGPIDPSLDDANSASFYSSSSYGLVPVHVDEDHRRLGFIPSYIADKFDFMQFNNTIQFKIKYDPISMTFTSFAMLFFVLGCLMLVFLSCFYHNQKTSPLFVSPRRHRLPKLVPPPLPVDSFFSWIKVMFFLADEEIITRIGYDALIFLRFHRLALRCVVKMGVLSFLIVLPLNFTGDGHKVAEDYSEYFGQLIVTDFDKFTMANVSRGSPRLWVHCVAAYLLTAIVVKELLVEYDAFSHVRHRYLLSREPHLRTVLVTNIPRQLRTPSKVTSYFKNVYPDAVKSVTLCQNVIILESLVHQRTSILKEIEQEVLLLCRSEKKRLVGMTKLEIFFEYITSTKMLENTGILNGPQERLACLYIELEELNDKIEKEQHRRGRVLKKLDQMESSTGSGDIDYFLAFPFVGDSPEHRKTMGMQSKNTGIADSKINSSKAPCSGEHVEGESASKNDHYYRLGNDKPPIVTTQLETDPSGHSFQEAALNNLNHRPKKPIKIAKHAISRYMHLGFFGISKRPSKMKSIVFPCGSKSDRDFIENHVIEVCDKAFVQMKTFTASTIAMQSMHSSKPGSMVVSCAPEPRDIMWENIYISKGAKRTRTLVGDLIVLVLITTYAVPVTLVSLLVSESALITHSQRLKQLYSASAFFKVAIAMIQPICLTSVQQLVPPFLMSIGRAEGHISFSEIQMRAFSRYFGFQTINIFLVTAIAGTVFDTIAMILNEPEIVFMKLGDSLPRMSSFFVTLVTLKTFVGLGVELVRVVALAQGFTRYVAFPNSTLREQRSIRMGMRAIDDPGWFPFHKVLAQDMLVVVISVVFAVVAPLVLIPCAMFYLCSRILWTHQHLYVYESVFETGGLFWPKIFRRFVFGLMIAQATITGQFLLKEAKQEAIATILLMFLTYAFLRSTRARYDATSSALPLEVATIMDISMDQEQAIVKDKYQPKRNAVDQKGKDCSLENVEESSYCSGNSVEDSDGTKLGHFDPFEYAYLQPALRAISRARPEQPFPPSQLGREECFTGIRFSKAGAVGIEAELGQDATVRLKSLNLQDRCLIDEWWSDQLKRAGEQNLFAILIGEQSGTLLLGKRATGLRQRKKQ